MENEKILNIKECALVFGISASSIRKYIKEGLPYFRVGNKLSFYESKVRYFFEKRK